MKIPHTKKVTHEVTWGEIEITKEIRHYLGNPTESYVVRFHHPIYSASPFTLGVTFSTEFTIAEILESPEVTRFLARFN